MTHREESKTLEFLVGEMPYNYNDYREVMRNLAQEVISLRASNPWVGIAETFEALEKVLNKKTESEGDQLQRIAAAIFAADVVTENEADVRKCAEYSVRSARALIEVLNKDKAGVLA